MGADEAAMDISTIVNPWLAWVTDQLALLSNVPPAYIVSASVVSVLIALMSRDLLATLWTSLFALGAISLCATQEINWSLLATLEAAAGFLLASTAVVRRRQSRAHPDELRVIRDQLSGLEERLIALKAYERLRISKSLHTPRRIDMTELLKKSKIPIAPK
jgi:hypothetical protein